MSIKTKIKDMLQLQDKLNRYIDPNWLENRTLLDFQIAINQEVAELIDTYPWKWWKKMEDDKENRKIELIDIWHFIMSYFMLTEYKKDKNADYIEITAKLLNDTYNVLHQLPSNSDNIELESILSMLVNIPSMFMDTQKAIAGTLLYFGLVDREFDSFDEFVKLYYAKNFLNIIRQDKGYKTGEYLKIIDGKEDNYHLMEAVKKIEKFENFDDFAAQLKEHLTNIRG